MSVVMGSMVMMVMSVNMGSVVVMSMMMSVMVKECRLVIKCRSIVHYTTTRGTGYTKTTVFKKLYNC
jgi:hypothetical protein